MKTDYYVQIAALKTDIKEYRELLEITRGIQPRQFLNGLLTEAEQKLRLLRQQLPENQPG